MLAAKVGGRRRMRNENKKSKIANSPPLHYNHRVKWRTFAGLLVLVLLCGTGGIWWWFEWRDHSQDAPILAAARRYGVAPALVKAVVWRETRFNPHRRGRAGEIGLMQIRPATAGDWALAERVAGFTPENLLDPGTNTLAGAWYLEKLLKRYARTDNPLPYALADYNAGRANVLKWEQGAAATNSAAFIEQINFPGAKNYVRAVTRRYQHYLPIFPVKQ